MVHNVNNLYGFRCPEDPVINNSQKGGICLALRLSLSDPSLTGAVMLTNMEYYIPPNKLKIFSWITIYSCFIKHSNIFLIQLYLLYSFISFPPFPVSVFT